MQLTDEDRWAITETIALHGHLFDNGELDRLDELFTADVVYDLNAVGMGSLRGIPEILRATLELGDANPVAHHVTNTTITEVGSDYVHTRCKAIAVLPGGRCGTATYIDTLRRDSGGWRISHRTVKPHRTPLNGVHAIDVGGE